MLSKYYMYTYSKQKIKKEALNFLGRAIQFCSYKCQVLPSPLGVGFKGDLQKQKV